MPKSPPAVASCGVSRQLSRSAEVQCTARLAWRVRCIHAAVGSARQAAGTRSTAQGPYGRQTGGGAGTRMFVVSCCATQEECRGWDINEAVFSPGMWDMYQPLLRADFKLFDEYTPSNTLAEARTTPLTSKMRLFWGQRDRRVTDQMVKVRNDAAGH